MITKLQSTFQKYPRQFWLMFVGMLISTIGSSMIWPFLLVYVSERLNAPLTAIASLLTLNSAMGLLASFLGGPIIDRLGRKWIMATSLLANGIAYLFMGSAHTLPQFAVLMAITGAVNPLYRVGADAMMADLLPQEKRVDGYAMMRLSNNLGISIGPAIGGFMAATSYSLAFYCAALGLSFYSFLIATFARETLPSRQPGYQPQLKDETAVKEKFGGYLTIWKDKPFIKFILTFTLVSICASLIWILLPVYATQTYKVPKSLYGFIPTTNAIMVVTLQLFITGVTKRFPTLPVVAVGAFFYAIAVGSVALMSGFVGFWICMVVMTIGELIIVPTSSTYIANLAPVDMRGRYMSFYTLTWGVAAGIGPVFGGFLNDIIGPKAIWLGGAIAGGLGVFFFLVLARQAALTRENELAQITLPTLE
jgi:MFS family permease